MCNMVKILLGGGRNYWRKDAVVLLITGCMYPDKDIPFLSLKDAEQRRTQYLKSIEYFIKETRIKKIVYCDNSNPDIEMRFVELAKKLDKEFEWISFTGNRELCVEKGKGFGEGEIIDYALKNSNLIHHGSYLIKVTGRVKVMNMDFLLRHMNLNYVYFQPNSSNNIDTRLYGMPLHVYQQFFIHAYREVADREGVYLENVFSNKVKYYEVKYKKFFVFPDIEGICGSTGLNYKLPLGVRMKRTLKMHIKKY